MSNILNTVSANRNLNSPDPSSSFLYDTAGRTKPLKDKGEILPSRIIGSPIEYAGDTIKDVMNIAKAAKGKANDHELGRINSLALKLGSLGIASYLFVKNPFKLSKAMEFGGLAAFFGSMALWPKLAIQLPVKLRTGVDFMQRYKDSQGRKKFLYQDPQYVLTDMLPRRDLDKIGKKLKVSEDLPDRDKFIKQRAHKTAMQANTLWMMTAGFAAPVMSALICNSGEKILRPLLQKRELESTEREFLSSAYLTEAQKAKMNAVNDAFSSYIVQNADTPLYKLMPEVQGKFNNMLEEAHSFELQKPLMERLDRLTYREVTEELIEKTFGSDTVKAVKEQFGGDVFKEYIEDYQRQPAEAVKRIANVISQAGFGSAEAAAETLEKAAKSRTIQEASYELKGIYSAFAEFTRGKKLLDKYIDARVGDRAGSYIANQWKKVTERFLKALNIEPVFTTGKLKELSLGDAESEAILMRRLEVLSSSDADYTKTVTDLMKMMTDYEKVTEGGMLRNTELLSREELVKGRTNRAHLIFNDLRSALMDNNSEELAGRTAGAGRDTPWSSPPAIGTIHRNTISAAQDRVLGAKCSFYRILHALDIFAQMRPRKSGKSMLEERIAGLFWTQYGREPDKTEIDKLVQGCKDVLVKGEAVDFIEKFTTRGFNFSEDDFQIIMKALYSENSSAPIREIAENQAGGVKSSAFGIFNGLMEYKNSVFKEVVNCPNDMRPDLKRRIAGESKRCINGIRKNDLIGSSIIETIAGTAKNKYNSKKWLLLFGGIMTGLTAVTLAAGFMLGRKGKTEEQAEAESRTNKNA